MIARTVPGRAPAMFVLFALTFAASQFHRVATGVTTPVLQAELGVSAEILGLAGAAFFYAAAAMQVPVGVLLDRYGARATVPALLLVAVAGTAVYATAQGATALFVGRVLIGAGPAAVMVGAFVVVARWYPRDRFATVAAMMVAAGSIGGLSATAPLAAAIEWWGWRPVFEGAAVLLGLLAVLGWLVVRDAPPGHRPDERRPASLRESVAGLGEVLGNRELRLLLAAGLVCYGPAMTLLGLWAGPYLADVHGLDALERGQVLLAMAAATPLGLALVGPLDRRFGTRKYVVLPLLLAMSAALALLAAAGDRSLWLAVACLVAVMIAQTFYIVLQAHCRSLFPDRLVGRANTLLNLAGILGVALMQTASGLIVGAFPAAAPDRVAAPGAYAAVFGCLALATAAAAACYARVRDVPPRPVGSPGDAT